MIMDVEDYLNEANRQLSDTRNDQKLKVDPTELHTEKMKAVINNYRNAESISKMTNSPTQKGKKHWSFICCQKFINLIIEEDPSLVL